MLASPSAILAIVSPHHRVSDRLHRLHVPPPRQKFLFKAIRHVQNLPQLPLASASLHCQIHVFMVSEHARACLQIASDKMH